ncbi:MAG TPA: hypothetical protein PKH39_03260, partial [Woeseiaceae bacterium]|nr:hypothetical protein [Woeseiaceae bacterium]
RRVIRQNIAWAIAYNLAAVPLAATGILAPWMAALGMSVSSLIVVLNALRLHRYGQAPRKTASLPVESTLSENAAT